MAVSINQGITDLATAIAALTVQASDLDATMNNRIGQLVTAIDNIPPGCGCPTMGTETPTGGVVEADPPPDGYSEWSVAIDERKCKLANMTFDDIVQVTEVLIANDVENIASLGVGALSSLLGMALVVLVSGPIAWGLAALGAISGVIAFFLLQSVNLGTLLTLLNANQEDLVCALYTSEDTDTALADFKAILSVAGANAAMLAYLDAIQMLNSLAVIYFQPDGAMGELIEQRLDGFVSTIDCATCVIPIGPLDWKIADSGWFGWTSATGSLGSGIVDQDGDDFAIQTVPAVTPNPNGHVIALVVNQFEQAPATCNTHGGQLRIVSSPGGYPSNSGTRCPGLVDCGNVPITVGMGQTGPGPQMNSMIRIWTNAPQTIVFAIDIPTETCP